MAPNMTRIVRLVNARGRAFRGLHAVLRREPDAMMDLV